MSCSSYKGIKLSVLTVDGRNRNGRIVNRYPDYGDGHLDGCIVMPEMRVDLYQNQKFKSITGKISNVESGESLASANVTLFTTDSNLVQISTNSKGEFEIVSDRIFVSIRVDYLAYRRFYAVFRE
jgi:hypothetical protein